jgi:hypothetical protein
VDGVYQPVLAALHERPRALRNRAAARDHERVFSHHFLKVENLREEIGNLRHYVMPAAKS